MCTPNAKVALVAFSFMVTALPASFVVCARQATDMSSTVDLLLRADTPAGRAEHWTKLLNSISTTDLANLCAHHNLSVALQAGWETVRRRLLFAHKPVDMVPAAGAESIRSFVSDLERRMNVTSPEWWENLLVNSHTVDCRVIDEGWEVEVEQADVIREVDRVVIEHSDGILSLPRSKYFDAFFNECETCVIEIESDTAYIACHSNAGFRFTLMCIEVAQEKPRWQSDVWAVGRSRLIGIGFHHVTVVPTESMVVVFGAESHGMYVEAFARETGANLCRFCTTLWQSDK